VHFSGIKSLNAHFGSLAPDYREGLMKISPDLAPHHADEIPQHYSLTVLGKSVGKF
jgi:hypothetical protein